MRYLALMLIPLLLSTSCKPQEEAKEKAKTEPNVSYNVDKTYDEHGNIIRYDSTYTWSYTNVDGDSVTVDVDSIMRSFKPFFNDHFPGIWDDGFGTPVWNDSLFYHDFFSPDYFYNRWERNFFEMEKMMRRMDSIRMKFFEDQYPGLTEPKIKKQKTKSTKEI